MNEAKFRCNHYESFVDFVIGTSTWKEKHVFVSIRTRIYAFCKQKFSVIFSLKNLQK